MRQPPKWTLRATLPLTLLLAGCGSAGAPVAVKPVAKISFDSPAIGKTIPARYTCDGKDVAPPLRWGAVPPGTGTLMLFAVGFRQTSSSGDSASIEWAVAGVNPRLHRLDGGRLPPGAYVGLTSAGKRRYSICPKKGTSERYVFGLYALPAAVVISRNFAAVPILEALANSSTATGYGTFNGVYKRA